MRTDRDRVNLAGMKSRELMFALITNRQARIRAVPERERAERP